MKWTKHKQDRQESWFATPQPTIINQGTQACCLQTKHYPKTKCRWHRLPINSRSLATNRISSKIDLTREPIRCRTRAEAEHQVSICRVVWINWRKRRTRGSRTRTSYKISCNHQMKRWRMLTLQRKRWLQASQNKEQRGHLREWEYQWTHRKDWARGTWWMIFQISWITSTESKLRSQASI